MPTDVDDVPDLLTGLATTRAIRRYRDEPIPEDDLASILWHATRADLLATLFEVKFAAGAMVAVLHDVLITLAVFSMLGLQIDMNVIAAILTLTRGEVVRLPCVRHPGRPTPDETEAAVSETAQPTTQPPTAKPREKSTVPSA